MSSESARFRAAEATIRQVYRDLHARRHTLVPAGGILYIYIYIYIYI